MIATITNAVKTYKNHMAMDHVSLSVAKGEALGLLGPNGAGKSTTIRVLTGLTKADAGEVTLFGYPLRGEARALKRRLGVVPQDLALYETLSARDNLNYFGRLYGLSGSRLKERVDEVLEVLGLTDVASKAPKKFSGGMKRRLNIGCAIVHSPELLILDEPTVGIDPQSRNHILDFVEAMNRQGMTVIYTSHYMEEVERVCSRVLIMDDGRVIANGSVEELTRSVLFEERTTLHVKNPTPKLMESLKAVQGVTQCEISGHKLTIVSTAGAANLPRVLECAASSVILGVTAHTPTLEDAFLALTGKKLRDIGEGA